MLSPHSGSHKQLKECELAIEMIWGFTPEKTDNVPKDGEMRFLGIWRMAPKLHNTETQPSAWGFPGLQSKWYTPVPPRQRTQLNAGAAPPRLCHGGLRCGADSVRGRRGKLTQVHICGRDAGRRFLLCVHVRRCLISEIRVLCLGTQ